jgi:hypothetical protein
LIIADEVFNEIIVTLGSGTLTSADVYFGRFPYGKRLVATIGMDDWRDMDAINDATRINELGWKGTAFIRVKDTLATSIDKVKALEEIGWDIAMNSRSTPRLTEANDDENFREVMSHLHQLYRHLKYFPTIYYSPDQDRHRNGDEAVWASNAMTLAARNAGLLASNNMNKNVFHGSKSGHGHWFIFTGQPDTMETTYLHRPDNEAYKSIDGFGGGTRMIVYNGKPEHFTWSDHSYSNLEHQGAILTQMDAARSNSEDWEHIYTTAIFGFYKFSEASHTRAALVLTNQRGGPATNPDCWYTTISKAVCAHYLRHISRIVSVESIGNNQYKITVATDDPNTSFVRAPLPLRIKLGKDVASVTLDGQDITTTVQVDSVYSKSFDISVEKIIGKEVEVTAKDEFANIIGNPGKRDFTIVVKNTGTDEITGGQVTWRLPTGWSVTGSGNIGALAAGASTELTFTFNATTDGSIGMSHVLCRIKGTRGGSEFIAFKNFPFEVRPYLDASFKPDNTTVLGPGQQQRFRVTLYNHVQGNAHYNAYAQEVRKKIARYIMQPLQRRSGHVTVDLIGADSSKYEVIFERGENFSLGITDSIVVDFIVKNRAAASAPVVVMPRVHLDGIGVIKIPPMGRHIFYGASKAYPDQDGRGLTLTSIGRYEDPYNQYNPNEGALLATVQTGNTLTMQVKSSVLYHYIWPIADPWLQHKITISSTASGINIEEVFYPTNGNHMIITGLATGLTGSSHKVAVTWDCNNARTEFYVDGNKLATTPVPNSGVPWVASPVVGKTFPGNYPAWERPIRNENGFFAFDERLEITGSASNFKIYTRALNRSGVLAAQGIAGDTIPPEKPRDVDTAYVYGDAAVFAWNPPAPSGDGEPVYGYVVERSGNILTTQPYDLLSYADYKILPDRTYYYKIYAVDSSGNMSLDTAITVQTIHGTIDQVFPMVAVLQDDTTLYVYLSENSIDSVKASYFSIDNGITVKSVTQLANGSNPGGTIVLTTSPHQSGTQYTLTVDGPTMSGGQGYAGASTIQYSLGRYGSSEITLDAKSSLVLQRKGVFNVTCMPNPFSTSVNIRVSMPNDELGMANIDVCIYDIKGTLVARFDQLRIPHSAFGIRHTWYTSNQPSGLYFLKVRSGKKTLIRRLMVIK